MDALREVQTLGGHDWAVPPRDAPVIGTLEDFDSLTGIEATVLVEQKLANALGVPEPLDLKSDSIFVSRDGRKALSLDQVVANVCEAIGVAA